MGAPLECEHPASGNGDTIQQTTTGLAAYTSATNTVSFTDGWRHWAITPSGFVPGGRASRVLHRRGLTTNGLVASHKH